MANKTIAQLDTITPTSADVIPIWDMSEGKTGKATLTQMASIISRSEFVVGGVSNSTWDWTSQFSVPPETTENTSFTIPADGLYSIRLAINGQNAGITNHNLYLTINGWEFAKVETSSSWNSNNTSITLRLKQGTSLNFTHYKSTTTEASGVPVGYATVNLFRVHEIF